MKKVIFLFLLAVTIANSQPGKEPEYLIPGDSISTYTNVKGYKYLVFSVNDSSDSKQDSLMIEWWDSQDPSNPYKAPLYDMYTGDYIEDGIIIMTDGDRKRYMINQPYPGNARVRRLNHPSHTSRTRVEWFGLE